MTEKECEWPTPFCLPPFAARWPTPPGRSPDPNKVHLYVFSFLSCWRFWRAVCPPLLVLQSTGLWSDHDAYLALSLYKYIYVYISICVSSLSFLFSSLMLFFHSLSLSFLFAFFLSPPPSLPLWISCFPCKTHVCRKDPSQEFIHPAICIRDASPCEPTEVRRLIILDVLQASPASDVTGICVFWWVHKIKA